MPFVVRACFRLGLDRFTEVEVGSEKIPVEVSIDDSRLSVSKDIEAEEDIFDEFYEILTMGLENMTMLFEGMKKGVDSIQDYSW